MERSAGIATITRLRSSQRGLRAFARAARSVSGRTSTMTVKAMRSRTRASCFGSSSVNRPRGLDDSSGFTEADAPEAFPLAVGAQDHFVAVFEERPLLAVRQRESLRAIHG